MIRIFYADPTSDSNPTAGTGAGAEGSAELDEKREPLWSRDMPGLKHIRGILYEDAYEAVVEATPAAGSSGHKKAASSSSKKSLAKKDSSSVEEKEQQLNDEADNFPMDCQVWTSTQFFSVSFL